SRRLHFLYETRIDKALGSRCRGFRIARSHVIEQCLDAHRIGIRHVQQNRHVVSICALQTFRIGESSVLTDDRLGGLFIVLDEINRLGDAARKFCDHRSFTFDDPSRVTMPLPWSGIFKLAMLTRLRRPSLSASLTKGSLMMVN